MSTFRLLAAGFLLLVSSLEVLAGQEIEASFGDWSKVCVTPDEKTDTAKKTCQIVQAASQNDKRVLQTSIGYIAGSDKPILTLTAPLGIYIPKGITLSINDTPTTAAVQRCDANGCLAFIALDRTLLEAMKKFDKGSVVVATSPQKNVKLPFSLKGFADAFASLTKPEEAKQ